MVPVPATVTVALLFMIVSDPSEVSALVRIYGSPVVPVPVTVTVVLPFTMVSDPSAPVLVRI